MEFQILNENLFLSWNFSIAITFFKNRFQETTQFEPTSENEVSLLIISCGLLIIEKRAGAEVQKRYFISSASYCIFINLFSKLRSNKESFKDIVHHRPINRGQYGLFLRNERFNVNFVISDYQLRSPHAAKHV